MNRRLVPTVGVLVATGLLGACAQGTSEESSKDTSYDPDADLAGLRRAAEQGRSAEAAATHADLLRRDARCGQRDRQGRRRSRPDREGPAGRAHPVEFFAYILGNERRWNIDINICINGAHEIQHDFSISISERITLQYRRPNAV